MNVIKEDILFKTFVSVCRTQRQDCLCTGQHRHLRGVFVNPGVTFVFCTCELTVPTQR